MQIDVKTSSHSFAQLLASQPAFQGLSSSSSWCAWVPNACELAAIDRLWAQAPREQVGSHGKLTIRLKSLSETACDEALSSHGSHETEP